MATEELGALRHRFEMLQGTEHNKNALIEVGQACTHVVEGVTYEVIRNFYNVLSTLRRITVKPNSIMPENLTLIETFR